MRPVVWLLVLATLAPAAEPDGAVAPAARWCGPRGPASGSLASRATPVVTDVEEGWRLDCEKIHVPPVHWDGRGYVVANYRGKDALVAFDLRTGAVLAHKSLPGVPRALHVWDHTVYCQVIDGQINAYRLRDNAIFTPWKYRGRRSESKDRLPHHPLVHDNEVYCLSGDCVVRLRPPGQWPVWAANGLGVVAGWPAVYGPTLFLVTRGSRFARGPAFLQLLQFDRARGEGTTTALAQTGDGSAVGEPEITVAPGMICVRSPWPIPTEQGAGHYALVPCTWSKGVAHPKGGIFVADLVVPPAVTRRGVLCLSREPGGLEWQLRRPTGEYLILAREKTQPRLFRDLVAPTILGDIAYCGSWAVDLPTRELLWKLPVGKISFPAVPADRLVLVVEDGKTLRAFRGRGRR